MNSFNPDGKDKAFEIAIIATIERYRKSTSTHSDNSMTSSLLDESMRNISLYADDETDESHSYHPLTTQASRIRPYENVPAILSNLHGTNKRLSARYAGLSGLLADPFTGKQVNVALADPASILEIKLAVGKLNYKVFPAIIFSFVKFIDKIGFEVCSDVSVNFSAQEDLNKEVVMT
ncbi:hypothetical protein ACTXT7_001225 [Hymenolepis weldensis]